MSLIRLEPFIYLMTPLGEAEAHFLRMETREVPYEFLCFQTETKECWGWPNHLVRIIHSISAGRDGTHSAIILDDDMKNTLGPHILRHKLSPLYPWADQYLRGNAGVREA